MKKILFVFPTIILFILIISPVFASPVEFDTTGICNIEGIIKAIEFKEAYEDPCVKNHSCPVGAYIPERPATYYLTIKLESISCIPAGEEEPLSYRAQFRLGAENIIAVDKNVVKEGDVFESGDKISGTVKYITLQHLFASYELVKTPKDNVINDNIVKQNNIVDNDQQKSNILFYLLVGALTIIVLIIATWFLLKKRKQR